MSDERNKNGLNIALGVLLVTWLVLLALLIFIFVLRMQGYQDFEDWQNRNQPPVTEQPMPTTEPVNSPTPSETMQPTPTTEPTATPTPTVTVTPTPTATATPTPTEIPTFLETIRISGDESIDAEIRRRATAFAEDERAELAYEVYTVGNYLSVVFHKPGLFEGEPVDELLPLVFDLTTKKQVTGSDFIKESYFAIIKERLQTYVAEQLAAAAGSDFITYREIYEAEDYQEFFLMDDSLVFWFPENTLLQEGQKPFSYAVPLEEAEAFLKYRLDGSKNGIAIRELDPDRPMLAFTFDDGPAFVNDLDKKVVELFLQYDGRATFFFVGDRMDGRYESYEKIAKAVYDAGFEVGSHTYSHTLMFNSAKDEKKEGMWKEFNLTNLAIADATGCAPDYIRLPGGSYGKLSLEFPMINVNWNVDSKDYQEKKKTNGAQIIADRMKAVAYQDGDILLYHSIYQTTYDALVEILPYLYEQGYQFVTLSELFYYQGIKTEYGTVYKNAITQTLQ